MGRYMLHCPHDRLYSRALRIWSHHQEPADESNALATSECQRLKELKREVRELRRSNDIPCQVSAYFAKADFNRHCKK